MTQHSDAAEDRNLSWQKYQVSVNILSHKNNWIQFPLATALKRNSNRRQIFRIASCFWSVSNVMLYFYVYSSILSQYFEQVWA